MRGGDQDVRVGGHRIHLPPQAHHKCIYMWSNSHWKQAGMQNASHAARSVTWHQMGRKRSNEVVGPVSLGGDTEEEGDYLGSKILLEEGVAAWITDWVPRFVAQHGQISPLSLFGDHWDWCQNYRNLDSTFFEKERNAERKKQQNKWRLNE